MISLIETNRGRLDEICRRFRVRRLEVFGSAVDGARFDGEHSDIDFLVEFLPLDSGQHADAYFGLLGELEGMLGHPVDLVMTKAVRNRYFLEGIRSSRTVLYAA